MITGAKSIDEVNEIATIVINYLSEYNVFNTIQKIKINNCVLISQLDFDINLEKLAVELLSYDAC